jgi:hypothetical protein
MRGSKMLVPDRFETVCKVNNKIVIEDAAKEAKPLYQELLQENPWLIYWFQNKLIPLGFPCCKCPATGKARKFTEVSAEDFISVMEIFPLGISTVGLHRSAIAMKYFPGKEYMGAPFTTVDEADETATEIKPSQNMFLLKAMVDCYVELHSWDYEALKVGLLTPPCATYEHRMTPSGREQVDKIYGDILKELDRTATSLASKHKTCGMIFNKIGQQALMICTEELEENDYFAAFQKIEKYFVNKGSSDTSSFEASAREIRIKPGQNFLSHWIKIQSALKRWAMVLGLHRDKMQRGPIIPLVDEDGLLLPAPVMHHPNVNTMESIANAGELSDYDIIMAGHRVLIPETTRILVLEDSLKGNDRFTLELSLFYGQTAGNMTMSSLVNLLTIRDESKPGQLAREAEKPIEKSVNKLNKDETGGKSAILGKTPPAGKFPKGSCINHPDCTTHTTEDCRAGASKDGKKYEKKYVKKHCTTCQKHNKKNPKAQDTHDTSECRFIIPHAANVNENNDGDRKPKSKRRRSNPSNDDDDEPSAYTIRKELPKADSKKMKFILSHYDELESIVIANKGSDKDEN